jgi:hypothetical protein
MLTLTYVCIWMNVCMHVPVCIQTEILAYTYEPAHGEHCGVWRARQARAGSTALREQHLCAALARGRRPQHVHRQCRQIVSDQFAGMRKRLLAGPHKAIASHRAGKAH